jgi:hypothetical protein
MKLNKNEFVLIYEPNNHQEFILGLVEMDSEPQDPEASLILFERKTSELIFEPIEEKKIMKDQIMKVQNSMIMHTAANENIVEVSYELDNSLFEKGLKECLTKYKTDNEIGTRSILQIKGKKSASEILKKIKINENELQTVKKKISKRKIKPEKFKKGKLNPLITSVVEGSLQLHGNYSKFVDDCCVNCNNRELIRALNTDNRILFDSILNSNGKIVTVLSKPSMKSNTNSILLSLEKDNDYYFEKLMNILYDEKKIEFKNKLLAPALNSR